MGTGLRIEWGFNDGQAVGGASIRESVGGGRRGRVLLLINHFLLSRNSKKAMI